MLINKEKNFISVVIYVHNNEKQIPYFFERLYNVLNNNFINFEVICVNDCSTDNSIQKIKEFASNDSNSTLSIINMSIYQDVELSMNAGIDLAIGDYVFEFDNLIMDYPNDMIMETYYHSLNGFDIVTVSPEKINNMSSRLFYSIFNHYSNNKYKLRTESFRILSRRAINRVHAMNITIPYRKAVYANSGLKIDTIIYKKLSPIDTKDTKLTTINRESIAINALMLFTNIAYKIATVFTIMMIFLTVFVGGYTVLVYFSQNKPVTGWTTIMFFLSVAFFGVFFILAIVIKYLSILVDLIFKKQKYLIESIEKITK